MNSEECRILYNLLAQEKLSTKAAESAVEAMMESVSKHEFDLDVDLQDEDSQEIIFIKTAIAQEKSTNELIAKMRCLFDASKLHLKETVEERENIYKTLVGHKAGIRGNELLVKLVASAIEDEEKEATDSFDRELFEKSLIQNGGRRLINTYIKEVPQADKDYILSNTNAYYIKTSTASSDDPVQ